MLVAVKWRVHVVLFQEIYVDTAIKFLNLSLHVDCVDHKENCRAIKMMDFC